MLPLRVAINLTDGLVGASGAGDSPFEELKGLLQRGGFEDVVPVLAEDYSALHDALHLHTADVGWCPPLVARDLLRVAAADPIAAVVRRGTDHYYSALVVRRGAGPRRVTDLPGFRIGWVSPMSAAGYVVARDYIASCGVRLAFLEERFYDTHARSAQALLAGEVDVIATYATLKDESLVLHPSLSEARIIGAAGPIPSDVIVASRGLPRALTAKVTEAFLRAEVSPTGPLATLLDAASFAPATSSHLEPLSRWVERSMSASLRPLFALVGAGTSSAPPPAT